VYDVEVVKRMCAGVVEPVLESSLELLSADVELELELELVESVESVESTAPLELVDPVVVEVEPSALVGSSGAQIPASHERPASHVPLGKHVHPTVPRSHDELVLEVSVVSPTMGVSSKQPPRAARAIAAKAPVRRTRG
jgi:hypothetical protein